MCFSQPTEFNIVSAVSFCSFSDSIFRCPLLHIRAVALNQMPFPYSLPSSPREHRNFGYVTIVYWVETRDFVKHVAIQSITKNILAQIFNSAESGKSWFQIWFILIPHSSTHLAILLTLAWISGKSFQLCFFFSDFRCGTLKRLRKISEKFSHQMYSWELYWFP